MHPPTDGNGRSQCTVARGNAYSKVATGVGRMRCGHTKGRGAPAKRSNCTSIAAFCNAWDIQFHSRREREGREGEREREKEGREEGREGQKALAMGESGESATQPLPKRHLNCNGTEPLRTVTGLLSQADSFIKAAINLIADLPSLPNPPPDAALVSAVSSLAGLLLVVPGHPEQV